MKLLNLEKINELQRKPKQIRNICIIAHVDHGKTTLADSLLASNGIISQKMAGKLRYMDSRKDEQERGITMKSSSIALLYKIGIEEYFINLIDSPGHVDFSSEVSTAIRLCDGAIVVVDVVEGVCPQTQCALKQAWLENITPVLVLNKIDRLILEKQLSPLDAYIHLTQVLEQVNVVMAQLFTTEVFNRSALHITSENTVTGLFDWSTGLEDADDSQLYFSPERGNVVFASAVDGWGFGVQDFASLYSKKLGIEESKLVHCLWGDYYIHGKTKEIMSGAQMKAKKPLFVQFVLENIWALYETVIVRKDKERLQKISESLQVHLTVRDLRQTDPKIQLQSFFSQWLPLANAVLDMVCTKLPAPSQITEEKAEKLMCSQLDRFDSLPKETQALKNAFLSCASDESAPVIVYISKMFPVDRLNLPQNQSQPLSSEEIAKRRDEARQRHALRAAIDDSVKETSGADVESEDLKVAISTEKLEEDSDVFLAFARVFSGTLCSGQELFVLGPKHDPRKVLDEFQSGKDIDSTLTLKDLRSDQHVTKVKIQQLYLLMGRDLQLIDKVPAGNVIGIAGLEEHVLKSATLSSTVACPAFTELQLAATPILRVAVEPKQASDLPALLHGLKLLNQADACVQVLVQETGEHVLVTAGEIHLERCLNDLQERYAKIEINVSEPIVPFRETIVDPPIVDMVNELILDNPNKKDSQADETLITITTANKQSIIKLRARPLPASVTALLENNVDLLRAMDQGLASGTLSDRTLTAVTSLRAKLEESWGVENVKNIWSLGPRRCGPNVLLTNIPDYKCPTVWSPHTDESDPRSEYDSSFINGFQLATLAGPLCEEPMMGVCFTVEEWNLSNTNSCEAGQPFGPVSGQIMSVVKEGCRRAFQAQPQRLMAAMYCCSIQVNAEVLGRMYAVLGRRHGRVLHGDMQEGSASFSVAAVLPVVESFNFAAEMRKQTSGLAQPQLFFSHWEVIDMDPFWRPSTEEEYTHFGEKADSGNRARSYVDAVRRRKGLAVQEKIVQFAEKQRTLSKKK